MQSQSTCLSLVAAAVPAAVLLNAGAGLAGCATFSSKPLDPEAELLALARRTVADIDAGVEVVRARPGEEPQGPPAPFDASDGLSEAEVVAVALTLNPDLRAKRLEIGEAQALLITAGLFPNPELGVGWRPGISSAPGYSADAELFVELLKPWERAARKEIARARIEEVTAEVADAELRLAAAARTQWLAVRLAEGTQAQLAEAAALRRRAADLVRRRRELGEGTELDVAAAELERAEVERQARRAEADLEAARQGLNRLLGLPPHFELTLSDSGTPLRFTVFEDPSDDEIKARVLEGRADLRALASAYRRAEEELRLAVYRQFPRVKVGPSFGHEPEGDDYLGVGASIELPLFDRNQGEIAAKESLRERAHAEYVALLHRLIAGASGARERLRRGRLELEAQEREVLPLLERSLALFEVALETKEINVLDWVAAQERILRARQAHLETLVRYREAVIDLESATGTSLARPLGAGSGTDKDTP